MSNNPDRPRHISIQSWHDLSPNLRRIVFHSPDLADYPFTCNGAHIQLLFSKPGQSGIPQLPERTEKGIRWADPERRPFARTYTLRRFDRERCTISVDFVLHGDNGPASRFASHPQIGQTVGLSRPGGWNPMLKPAAHYLLAGDLTALPAIHAMLDDMPADAAGNVLLWLPEPADLPTTLPQLAGIRIHTFYGVADDGGIRAQVAATFAACRVPLQNSYVWLAGEAALVGTLRQIARGEWALPLKSCYAVPYWRCGEAEEVYHDKRHDFMDADSEPA